jgi:transcriptional regulator with XRE-family HTH domain
MELSLRANLSQSFLANLESGKKQPSVLTLIKIASALEVNPKEFFPVSSSVNKQQIKEEIINLLGSL